MSFPDNCIRGIPNEGFLLDERRVGAHLFYFDRKYARDDGWVEHSINWEDTDSVIKFTLNQRKENGTIQFKAGVVIIPRCELDKLKRRPAVGGVFSYERKRLEDNPNHGNLLLRDNVSKPIKKMIAAGLALAVDRILLQNQD